MTIQISTEDARTAKAIELLAGADRWLKIKSKADGIRYFVIEGSNGRVYWTNLRRCSCPDVQRRPELTCKHRIAVALRVAQVRAMRADKAQRRPGGPRRAADSFRSAASIGGRIGAPERARLVALANDLWGTDGEGS